MDVPYGETISDVLGITPQMPLGELEWFFVEKFENDPYPDGLTEEILDTGGSCYLYAKLIVLLLREKRLDGKIVEVEEVMDPNESDEDTPIHAYVVVDDDDPESLAYNNTGTFISQILTNAEVLQRGADVTEKILASPWGRL